MRRVVLILVVVILLVAGGYMSYTLSRGGSAETTIPGVRIQTSNPSASVFTVTSDKGVIFLLVTMVVLSGVIGTGILFAVASWLVSRQVTIARATDKPAPPSTANTAS